MTSISSDLTSRRGAMAMDDAFWHWAISVEPMPREMAAWSIRSGPGGRMGAQAQMLPAYLGGKLCAQQCADRARQWAAALAREPRVGRSPSASVDPKDMGSIARSWANSWGEMLATGGKNADSWNEHGQDALRSAISLERALGLVPAFIDDAAFIDAMLSKSVADYVKKPKTAPALSAKAWLGLGAAFEGVVKSKTDPRRWGSGIEGDYTCLQACLLRPSGWLLAGMLSEAGAKVGSDWHGRVRQAINCALSEDASRSGAPSAPERVACAVSLLSAMGSGISSYRGKGGERFDEFALGALWSNPSGELVEALSSAGVKWSSKAKAKACELATRRLKTANGSLAASLAALTAVGALDGLGPFGPKWVDLAHAAKDACRHDYGQDAPTAEAWGDAFSNWARVSGWSGEQLARLAGAWPHIHQSKAFASSLEAAAIAANAGPSGSEGARPKARSGL